MHTCKTYVYLHTARKKKDKYNHLVRPIVPDNRFRGFDCNPRFYQLVTFNPQRFSLQFTTPNSRYYLIESFHAVRPQNIGKHIIVKSNASNICTCEADYMVTRCPGLPGTVPVLSFVPRLPAGFSPFLLFQCLSCKVRPRRPNYFLLCCLIDNTLHMAASHLKP